MAAVFAFLGMLLISLLVALLAALQLGDFFSAGDEFPRVIAAVAGFTAVSLAVFATTYAVTRRAGAITLTALVLALVAVGPLAFPGLPERMVGHWSPVYSAGMERVHMALELTAPALLAVLVQWGLVHRRWLHFAGVHDLSRWPWFVTVAGALLILNPFGLAFVWATVQPSAADRPWETTASITAGVLCGLLLAAWIECYIRERILNRRWAPSSPSPAGAAPNEVLQNADAGKD